MADVTRKTEVGTIDGTPKKRLFWSIISDYDLKTAICELVDNAIDHWMSGGRSSSLSVSLDLDTSRQTISVIDNAGGVAVQDLDVLVAPGGSLNDPNATVIGVFGVGSKRAGVALGEVVEIRTRKGKGPSMAIEINPDWLASDDWEIAKYEVPQISAGTTEVLITRTRRPFRAADVAALREHLADTYARFLGDQCVIRLDGKALTPNSFDSWAFPPEYPPRSLKFDRDYGADGVLHVEIVAGLIRDRDPEAENYGVYFYCNDRQIVKELKVRDVGYFVSSEAGVPHPDASLCRVLIYLSGPAKLMPWTSNKSAINYDHEAFRDIRGHIVQLVTYYSKLSRRTKDDWGAKVFKFGSGEIEEITPEDATPSGRLKLVALPRANKTNIDVLRNKNASVIKSEPWTLGLIEAMAVVDDMHRKKLHTKNRIALILLDSNFEIALKEFIVHRHDLFSPRTYNDAKIASLFSNRNNAIDEVASKVPSIQLYVSQVKHYYLMRNKLIHERATVDIPEFDVRNYRSVVEKVLGLLFRLKFPAH